MGKDKSNSKCTDLMELLESLEHQTIELAAVCQAAKDYITLKEVIIPFRDNTPEAAKFQTEINSAYNNLRELVNSRKN